MFLANNIPCGLRNKLSVYLINCHVAGKLLSQCYKKCLTCICSVATTITIYAYVYIVQPLYMTYRLLYVMSRHDISVVSNTHNS